MRPTDPRLLSIRALNELRILHPPTYVALRYLLDSSVVSPESGWLHQTLPWKYVSRVQPRFWPVYRFKKLAAGDQIKYRPFLIPSPTTALTEAVVLDQMSRSPAFSKPAFVYSYQWPVNPRHAYTFQHFIMGYKSRAKEIGKTLSQTTTDVAVVADIKDFYPQIKQRIVIARFQDAVGRSEMEGGIKETAITLAQHVFAGFPGEVGMAIGPLTSHILSDFALTPVDQAISERYPGRYFRYVDDIVIVVPRDQVENAKSQLKQALDVEGLKLNEEKTDVVSREDWLSHCPDQAVEVSEDSFEALRFRIKVFLCIHPGALESLEKAFLREGFALPFQYLLAAANRSYFRTRLGYLMGQRWRVLWQAVSDSEDSLILRALGLRKNLLERVRKRFDRGIPPTGMKQRWALQEARYAVNRLVYLLPRERFDELAHMTEGTKELIETYMFLSSVRRGEFEELLRFPGPSVAAAAAFLRRDGRTTAITRGLSEEEVHSAALFSLYGVCSLSTNTLSALEHKQREYLRFCLGIPSDKREANDFSYLDEIRSLQLGRQAMDRLRMLDKRFADEEVTLFEALYIGEYYGI